MVSTLLQGRSQCRSLARPARALGAAIGTALLVSAVALGGCGQHEAKPSAGASSAHPSASSSSGAVGSGPKRAHHARKKSSQSRKPLPAPRPAPPEAPSQECGSAVIDGASFELDCQDLVAPSESTGADVVPRDALERDPKRAGGLLLPQIVDHREEGTEGPTRNQGHAGSCTAFALAAAMDHALSRREQAPYAVSALHLWSRFHHEHHEKGSSVIEANFGLPIASEADWPYDQKLAFAWDSRKGGTARSFDGEKVRPHQPVDPRLLQAADGKPYARLLHVTHLGTASTLDKMRILARGQDLFFSMKINRAAFSEARSAEHVIGSWDPDSPNVGGGHAMVLSGYVVQSAGTYFLMHNSWSEKFGDHGYAWLHEDMLKHGVFVVDAIPVGPTIAGANPPMIPPAACPSGEVPDSATEHCAATCADGSPRFDGACPGSSCDAGEIDVDGACVAAAPTEKGQVSSSHVAFECRPAGCVYTLPTGQASCKEPSCAFSCPAPAFVLAACKEGVFCSE